MIPITKIPIKIVFLLALGFSSYVVQAQLSTSRIAPIGFFTVNSSATPDLGSNGYIDGYVKKEGNAEYLFPVGHLGALCPFYSAGGADGIHGAYFSTDPTNASLPAGGPYPTTLREAQLNSISSFYWDINGASSTIIALTWSDNNSIATLVGSDISTLTIVGWNANSSQWEVIPSRIDTDAIQGGNSAISGGSISTVASIVPDTYQIYSLAAIESTPLPVHLLTFKANLTDQATVELGWSTSSEQNSSHFEIEHSTQGHRWLSIGRVATKNIEGSINNYLFEHNTPELGENLYRLKMVDQDDTYSYSRLLSIQLKDQQRMMIYPNPTKGSFAISQAYLTKLRTIRILTSTGQQMYRSNSVPIQGIDVRNFSSGLYIVEITLRDGTQENGKLVIN